MAALEEQNDGFDQEAHQVAYIFDGRDEESRRERATKRRRVSKKHASKDKAGETPRTSFFVPLLNGAESRECVELREKLYSRSWEEIHGRIQTVLGDSNSATLEQVCSFVSTAKLEADGNDQIPAAFITTGLNIASQDLLFEQLSSALLEQSPSKFVRLRSSEASSLKNTLKKIVREVTKKASDDDDDDLQVSSGKGERRFLDYDLAALHASIQGQPCEHVFVAFQDSEAFDSGLLSELIVLFHSWRPQIPFTLLFGVATSVDMLQTRLLKSACRLIYGSQFDVVQTDTILENVFKAAVAAADVPVLLGGPLLRSMLDRQHYQIASIQAFISSLKYAYMCHFYANPLSIFIAPEIQESQLVTPDHLEAVRNTNSIRTHIESAIDSGTQMALDHAKNLIESDNYLLVRVKKVLSDRSQWMQVFLRALLVVECIGAHKVSFSTAFVDALEDGISLKELTNFPNCIRGLEPADLAATLHKVVEIYRNGDSVLQVEASSDDEEKLLIERLEKQLDDLQSLIAKSKAESFPLRSKYSSGGKVMRTTVIAQRVQLSQDSAELRDEDKKLTEIIDNVVEMLAEDIEVSGAAGIFLSESWLYDSRAPSRDVFVPRPRAILERCLDRPYDYLACSCCTHGEGNKGGGVQATLPATSILYHLYRDTGNLINVADLWSAYYALVGGANKNSKKDENSNGDGEGNNEMWGEADEADERKALVSFYQGLAELRALGFVKASKKKIDHVAKLKWL